MSPSLLDLAPIDASTIDGTAKGVPPTAGTLALGDVGAQGWNVLAGDLPLPAATLRESALRRNGLWMRTFLESTDVSLCPHGKTTMSPQLFDRQLRDGAWGITAATLAHLFVYRRFGVQRVLYANQLLGRPAIDFVFAELHRDPDFDFYCLIDSPENLSELVEAARRNGVGRPLQLLLEVGADGGRTGVRRTADALALARAVRAAAPAVTLRGIEAFEGLFDMVSDESDRRVEALLDRFVEVARACDDERLFADDAEVLLTAGGSAYFDVVTERLQSLALNAAARIVLRCGCYLTHDTGLYSRVAPRMRARSARIARLPGEPEPALELWAWIQSRPEPGRVIAALGKRDASHDAGLPTARRTYRARRDAAPRALPDGCTVVALNDHHAYVDVPEASDLGVGDLISFETAHPCTTFDKWPLLYVVDDALNVTSAIRTFF